MSAGKRANDGGGQPTDYELGDLEIVSHRRPSGERAVERVQTAPAEPGMASAAARVGAPRTLTLDESDDGPGLELDIPAPVSRRPAPGSTTSARPGPTTQQHFAQPSHPPARPAPPGARGAGAGVALASLGDSLDDDFEDGGFANLPAIEVENVAARSAERVIVRDSTPEDPRAKEQKEAKLVAELADFGDVPRGLVACVRYAARVGSRVLKLQKERRAVQLEVQQHAAAHHAALVGLGHELMELSSDKRFEGLRSKVAQVLDAGSKVESAGASVEQTRSDNQRAIEQLQAQVTEQQQKLSPFVEAERAALGSQRKADEEVRRAQAMHKRGEIELRALAAAAAPDQARIDALTGQLEQRRTVVSELTGTLALANEALGRARRELALAQGALDVLLERHRQLERAGHAREAEARGQHEAAGGARDMALRELAESARTQKLSTLLPAAEQRVLDCDATLQVAGETLVRFDRALALYDRTAVFKGIGLVIAIVLAGLALLIFR